MKRREFITTTAAAAAGLMFGRETSGEDSGPNILFIMTDQQHAGMMSCTGNKWLKTPALDLLAASGIRFERAYACNPVCVPNRFSLQSGLMPSAIGMGRNEATAMARKGALLNHFTLLLCVSVCLILSMGLNLKV